MIATIMNIHISWFQGTKFILSKSNVPSALYKENICPIIKRKIVLGESIFEKSINYTRKHYVLTAIKMHTDKRYVPKYNHCAQFPEKCWRDLLVI